MLQWGNVSLLYLHLHKKTEITCRWDLHSVLNFSARPSFLICRRWLILTIILTGGLWGCFQKGFINREETLWVWVPPSQSWDPSWMKRRETTGHQHLFLSASILWVQCDQSPYTLLCPVNCTLKPWAKGSEQYCHSHGRRNQHNVVIPTVWDVKD